MKLMMSALGFAVLLGACTSTPPKGAVAANQQRAFQRCFDNKLLHHPSLQAHVRGRHRRHRDHAIILPPSPTPDIHAITQACL